MKHRVTLAPFTEQHVDTTYAWVCDADLRRDFLMRGEVTPEGHVAHFHRVLADPEQVVFAILAERTHVGNAGFKAVRRGQGAELWVYIGDPEARGKGIGREAVRLLIEQEAPRLRLRWIYLHVATFNEAAIRLYASLGFRQVDWTPGPEWEDRGIELIRMEREVES